MSSELFKNFIRKVILERQPGPPPRQGLQWKPTTHRWIRPLMVSGSEISHDLTPRDFKMHHDHVASDVRMDVSMGRYDKELNRLGYNTAEMHDHWLKNWHKSGLNSLMESGIARYMDREPSKGLDGGKFGQISGRRDINQDEKAVDFFSSIARKHEDKVKKPGGSSLGHMIDYPGTERDMWNSEQRDRRAAGLPDLPEIDDEIDEEDQELLGRENWGMESAPGEKNINTDPDFASGKYEKWVANQSLDELFETQGDDVMWEMEGSRQDPEAWIDERTETIINRGSSDSPTSIKDRVEESFYDSLDRYNKVID